MTSLSQRYPLSSGTPLLVAACYALAVVVPAHAPLREWVELVFYYARNMYPIWILVGVVLLLIQMLRDQRSGRQRSMIAIVRDFAKGHWDYYRGFSFLMPPIVATMLLATYNMFKQRVLPSAGFAYSWLNTPPQAVEVTMEEIDPDVFTKYRYAHDRTASARLALRWMPFQDLIATLAKKTGASEKTVRQQFIDRQPMGRLGTPQEIAALAVYLASDEASYTTGQIHLADGGFAM